MNVPEEIARREDRLRAIAEAKTKIEQRTQERYAFDDTEYHAKVAKRQAKARKDGKAPAAPVIGARNRDQINLTDKESRIMKMSGDGFEQCYNGQLAVDMGSMLIVNADPMARFTEPSPLKEGATEMERMRHLLLTMAGRAFYAQRKSTVEPMITLSMSALGFRQFSLRGLENVKGEMNLVAMAWNLKRMFVLAGSREGKSACQQPRPSCMSHTFLQGH